MSDKAVEVVLLCEDLQQACFLRRFLMRHGRSRYQFRPLLAPAGLGSGEQWVRCEFPGELSVHRNQSARRNTKLIVATDADTLTVQKRIQTLEDECERQAVSFRQPGERVAFAIPRRNIETWLAYLRGETVDELCSYPKYDCESLCQPQVERLDEMCRNQKLEGSPPPSLENACGEYGRIVD